MDSKTPQDSGAGTKNTGQQGGGKQYNIPDAVLEKYGELVEKIKKTESMSHEEREYWFQILPIMTEDQVTRLRGILEEESKQLKELDSEYQGELKKLNEKHMQEWNEFEKKKEREARASEEASHEVGEAAAEEALLGELDKLDDESADA
ncbi:hypothetical protein HOD30_05030 [Candidatus Peregrinibacteria bacterium]|jgi:hypothetical protein|nr:hypothetical protein [Candidatus Peregrinibacteria bacterium]MBT4631388.1 hypothetical protein [Candidatus Peregrinibacteria bacterium]